MRDSRQGSYTLTFIYNKHTHMGKTKDYPITVPQALSQAALLLGKEIRSETYQSEAETSSSYIFKYLL